MKPGYYLQSDQLQLLLDNLLRDGYLCLGPQVRDDAIIFDSITSVTQLPQGVRDKQAPGSYSLSQNTSAKYFDWANGPQAIKPLLFAPREKLWQSQQAADGHISFETSEPELKPIAIIGARACDIAAMKIQDQHFLQQQFVDPYYKQRRENILIIAVNCGSPADTCFCHSTGDGPFVDDSTNNIGADIILTELQDGFLVAAYTDKGEKLLNGLSLRETTETQLAESESIAINASKQNRQLPLSDIRTGLLNALDSESWQNVAERCLSCGNCTAVCPTCFCHSENDLAELDGRSSAHYREWDSCFSQGHSYIHGITIRAETSQRYRQWLTHKFASWVDQYGRSGCVGCGRCITWCPVGIDVVESVSQVIEHQKSSAVMEKRHD